MTQKDFVYVNKLDSLVSGNSEEQTPPEKCPQQPVSCQNWDIKFSFKQNDNINRQVYISYFM